MTTTTDMTATYDPADNKCRIRSLTRLPRDLYERVRAAGFIWAPKQELFVAPAWSPAREDLMLELCGEIGDEDTTLVDRAEERAERFDDYSDKRADEARSAHKSVESICDHIPLGQPILVGHHSERHARKDAERIESGMRKAVKMWETSEYWKQRAAGALRHAKYKELPAVRARRIKGIEADKRKEERYAAEYARAAKFWRGELTLVNQATGEKRPYEVNYENAIRFTGSDTTHMSFEFPLADYPRCAPASQYEGRMGLYSALGSHDGQDHAIITVEKARELALGVCERVEANAARWIAHYDHRLEYERAMLEEGGGLTADKFTIGIGGQVLRRGDWFVVTKLNRIGGTLNSVTVLGHFASTIPIEEITDYRAPKEGDFEKVKAVTAKAPICNYPGKNILISRMRYGSEDKAQDCVHITQAQWDSKHADYKGTRDVAATETVGRHRVRYGNFSGGYGYCPVFIMDAKVKLPPAPEGKVEKPTLPELEQSPPDPRPAYQAPNNEFTAMRETLKAGVKVVTAPQLFPTPPELCRRMIDAAGILAGRRILEPSAGTGNLVHAAISSATGADCCKVVAVEVNVNLVAHLREQVNKTLYANDANFHVICADFLQCNGDLGLFDVVLMNPPFERGSDIAHINHARKFLKPGGKIVALCANGPRQQEALRPIASEWIDLPAGSFAEAGTNVNVAMLVIEAE